MITNSTRIIRQIKQLIETYSNMPETEILDIGIRFGEVVDKIQCTKQDLQSTVFRLIDGSLLEKYKDKHLTSLFIADKTGSLIYDSKEYVLKNDRFKLKKEKDERVLRFNNLSPESKEAAVNMLASQIQAMDNPIEDKVEKDPWSDLNLGAM